MKHKKSGFTMIELVFVIVVLGILASIALPKFTVTRNDAQITKARADISSIRSGIVTERQSRLIKGDATWISAANMDSGSGDFFGGVLSYGVSASTGNDGWSGTAGSGTYTLKIGGSSNTFAYTPADGKFLCTAGNECDALTK